VEKQVGMKLQERLRDQYECRNILETSAPQTRSINGNEN
jgi:hypothetical protein